MGRIWAVAANGFREVLDRRLAWIAVLLGLLGALLVGLMLWPGSDSPSRRASAWSVYFILDAARSAAGLLGLVVGSGVLASEMRARTIVTLLARPVERWEFVLGRWLGAQLFAALLIAEGVATALLLAWLGEVELPAAFWMGLVHLAVRTVMWCALSVALGAVLSPVMAGFATVTILTVAPRLGLLMLHADAAWLRAAGALAYYASPALMPADLMRHGVESELWNPRWILYGAVLAENALYVTAALAVACLVFSRREIRLG